MITMMDVKRIVEATPKLKGVYSIGEYMRLTQHLTNPSTILNHARLLSHTLNVVQVAERRRSMSGVENTVDNALWRCREVDTDE